VTQLTEPVRTEDPPQDPVPGPSERANLARLGITVLAVILLAVVTRTTDVLIVIVAIIAMVMLHELGHFATAKWSHMKVTEYFLGFGPRLWSFKRGETEYGVKALPLGGYVKIVGMSNLEEVPPEDEPRTYRQQPFHNRLLVAVAGSAVHFILALILIFAVLTGFGVSQPGTVQVQALTSWQGPQSPARAAGVEPGDVIVSIDGHPVHDLDQVSSVTSVSEGRKVVMVVRRDGHLKTLTLVPTDGHLVRIDGVPAVPASVKNAGLIGVELANPLVTVAPLQAAGRSFVDLGSFMKESVLAVWDRFSPAGIANLFDQVINSQDAQKAAATGQRPESIYGAVRTATQGVQAGWAYFLQVLVVINVFIGLLNLFPMLPLDGGHVLIAVYERVRSRRGRPYHADVAKLTPFAYAFVMLLGFVVLSSFYLDITHPIPNPFK
jgi:membrane-associated protease RseP (regulator of RpoE activity)